MRRLLSVVLLALSGPVWVLGLALTPIAWLRQLCYHACAKISREFLRRNRPVDWREDTHLARLLRMARRRGAKTGRP